MPAGPRQRELPGMEEPEDAPAAAATPNKATATPVSSAANPATDGPPDPDDLTGKRVWVIDSLSLIFQVFHAIPEMTGPAGQPVNAIFGFTRDLFYLLGQQKPDFLFCAF